MRDNEDRLAVLPTADSPSVQLPVETTPNNPLSFVSPTEFVELPSKGELYPDGHPLKNKTTVEIKFMTAKEEDILTSRTLIKKGIAIDRMLESLLVDKSIKADTLLLGDKNALIIAARISGYGEQYHTSVNCPACNTNVKFKFNLQDIKHSEQANLEELGVLKTQNGTFTFSLPKTKAVVEVRPLLGKDEVELADLMEKKKKANLPEQASTTQMKMYLVSVNGNKDKNILNSFVDNLPALDARMLRTLYKKIIPNVDMTQQFLCSSCSFEQDMEVPFTVDFFWPK